MSNNFINVHEFDGKLNGFFKTTRIYSIKEKNIKFSEFIKKLSNPYSIKAVQSIISDLDKSKGDNFQAENNVDASDILICLLYLDKPDLIKNLNEQLEDIYLLGKCPSGRVTRLLQLWLAFN